MWKMLLYLHVNLNLMMNDAMSIDPDQLASSLRISEYYLYILPDALMGIIGKYVLCIYNPGCRIKAYISKLITVGLFNLHVG